MRAVRVVLVLLIVTSATLGAALVAQNQCVVMSRAYHNASSPGCVLTCAGGKDGTDPIAMVGLAMLVFLVVSRWLNHIPTFSFLTLVTVDGYQESFLSVPAPPPKPFFALL